MPTEPPTGTDGLGWSSSWDDALRRLEDVLLTYPTDRALPDLRELLEQAHLPEGFLLEDDRALKLLRDAINTRPLATIDEVSRLRTEVELLTLEARVIGDRIAGGGRSRLARADRERTHERLERIRQRLSEIRRLL